MVFGGQRVEARQQHVLEVVAQRLVHRLRKLRREANQDPCWRRRAPAGEPPASTVTFGSSCARIVDFSGLHVELLDAGQPRPDRSCTKGGGLVSIERPALSRPDSDPAAPMRSMRFATGPPDRVRRRKADDTTGSPTGSRVMRPSSRARGRRARCSIAAWIGRGQLQERLGLKRLQMLVDERLADRFGELRALETLVVLFLLRQLVPRRSHELFLLVADHLRSETRRDTVPRIEIQLTEPVRRIARRPARSAAWRTTARRAAAPGRPARYSPASCARRVEHLAKRLLKRLSRGVRPRPAGRFRRREARLRDPARDPGAPGWSLGIPQPGLLTSIGRKPTVGGSGVGTRRRASDSKSPASPVLNSQ